MYPRYVRAHHDYPQYTTQLSHCTAHHLFLALGTHSEILICPAPQISEPLRQPRRNGVATTSWNTNGTSFDWTFVVWGLDELHVSIR